MDHQAATLLSLLRSARAVIARNAVRAERVARSSGPGRQAGRDGGRSASPSQEKRDGIFSGDINQALIADPHPV